MDGGPSLQVTAVKTAARFASWWYQVPASFRNQLPRGRLRPPLSTACPSVSLLHDGFRDNEADRVDSHGREPADSNAAFRGRTRGFSCLERTRTSLPGHTAPARPRALSQASGSTSEPAFIGCGPGTQR